jgi:DNA repair exonuclease SbcCD ATPase subunit
MESGQEVRFASKSPGEGEVAPLSAPPRLGTPSGGGARSRALSPSSQAHKRLVDDIRISILREQMEQLEAERAKILEESRQVKAENQERLQDQADIYYYLNKKLDSYYEMINKLEEMIVKEQSEREAVEKDYEKTIEKLNSKIANDELKASSKIAELEDKLELSRKFYEQKPLLEAEIAGLKVQLSECQEAGKRTSDDWERRLVLEKRRLREEMEAKMDALRAAHAEEIERKLSLKTKKTKIANALYRRELLNQVRDLLMSNPAPSRPKYAHIFMPCNKVTFKYLHIFLQTKQAEDLTEKDRELHEQDQKLRAEIALHRDMIKEMENKLTAYRKTVKSLTDQLDAKVSRWDLFNATSLIMLLYLSG